MYITCFSGVSYIAQLIRIRLAGVRYGRSLSAYTYNHIYLHTRALSAHHSDPCALSALEPFFCDFSAARPRFVARLARSASPQPRGPCPRADPPSPRPSRSVNEVASSRLRGLPHAPQSPPCFFTTTSLLRSSYSPAVTLFFFVSFWFSTVMV